MDRYSIVYTNQTDGHEFKLFYYPKLDIIDDCVNGSFIFANQHLYFQMFIQTFKENVPSEFFVFLIS